MNTANPKSSTRGLTNLLDSKFMVRLDSLDILSRKVLQGKVLGERRAKRRGQSVEFADHRPYIVGDDLRFVDWNIFGRLEQLFLKLFLAEQDLTIHILVDFSGSTDYGTPSKSVFIRRMAAALTYIGVVNNNRVTLSAMGDGIVSQLPNMRGRNYLSQMAEFLLSRRAEGPSNFDKACRQLVTARSGTGVVIVLSDMLFKEGYADGLRRLISRQYELYVIEVLCPQELSPELTGDLKLVDVEDGDEAEISVSAALLEYYKRNVSAYCNELKAFCTRRGATYVLANSADAVEPLVLNMLRRVGLFR